MIKYKVVISPNSNYYNKWYGKKGWRGATIISNAIGQGEILATPIQIANFCEENFDKTEASTDMKIRAQATEAGEKVTEKVVEARVKLDSDYQNAFAARNSARALKEGFKMKGNMLIQLATNIREELKNLGHSVSADTAGYNEYFNN